MNRFLFINASLRESGHIGNTEVLARRAAQSLSAGTEQTWVKLCELQVPAFVDQRHTIGTYPMPEGDAKVLLDYTLKASDIVFVSPVYWYSAPSVLKTYLDHWSAWMRVPGVPFKESMASKRLWVITTSGDRIKAQPMLDSYRLCAEFLGMAWMGSLWGKGGAPDVIQDDGIALIEADLFFKSKFN